MAAQKPTMCNGGFSIPDKDVILDRLNAVDVRQRPKVSRFGVDNGWIPQSARGGGVSKEKRDLITKLVGRMRELGCNIDHRERILKAEHRSDVLMERLQRLGVVFDARNRVGFVPETTGVVESAEILHDSDDQEQHHVDMENSDDSAGVTDRWRRNNLVGGFGTNGNLANHDMDDILA
eukprot:gene17871-21278_t